MKAVDVLISGRVQKVGYRAFTRKNALLLGIKGYVENMPDGKVHAVLEGDDHQIDKLLELLRQGPVVSQVRDIKVTEIERAGHQGFEVR
ncbi:acylphosphatase [Methanocella arvoryzae]|uniref:Acylphosphatase n=1 Tax=Methanocella arvoryzae (strain DSM 22066 / NBRC 105507 / MRE50) TaxID=351160 RepID=ACYP_METAR|nr:acylphosphatase [Methanocella arvoryzae]Q0W6M8.1 RecName: Full=Acylphosphatase; AltName: Full=Acylphosphate phosphohydrolase [Methanocella arvoryzae MRE50]CAJ35965.1 acylphosphatase [Methanocella arvoryzae MRE50]